MFTGFVAVNGTIILVPEGNWLVAKDLMIMNPIVVFEHEELTVFPLIFKLFWHEKDEILLGMFTIIKESVDKGETVTNYMLKLADFCINVGVAFNEIVVIALGINLTITLPLEYSPPFLDNLTIKASLIFFENAPDKNFIPWRDIRLEEEIIAEPGILY